MEKQITIADRTKQFAIRIIKACHFLNQQSGVLRTLSNQLLRSGTSIGANVREAQSAQSHRDFLSKLEIALKEARETQYWIEILIESGMVESSKFNLLLQEATEITKILIASTKKLKSNL
ncbi:MAG TPA: four helix bundle protein [Coleofasciculaceae cyanobacterium]|jgi:four helix bundle protein